MSVAGKYSLIIKTPMGEQEGEMTLIIEKNFLRGTLSNSAGSTEFTDGTVNGNELKFNTKIKTPLGRLKAQVTGKVEGNIFSGNAKLPIGTAQITGTRKE